MGEKDISEKALLSYNDVFADILNVLIFGGDEIITPEDLTEEEPHTYYYDKEHIREQEQDVVKNWTSGDVQFACIGFENQTQTDPDMVFRVFSYEGARYRKQLNQGSNPRYPVVTLVLHYGTESPWNRNKTIHERIQVRPEIKDHVVDFKINVYDIAYLSPETVSLFQSDFRIVADYFVQMRLNKDYIPSDYEIHHVQETLHLLAAVTDDERFEASYIDFEKEAPKNMCEVIDKYINMGIEQGIEQGLERGIEQGLAQAVKALMDNMNLSLAQAMAALKIPSELQDKLRLMI